MIAISAGVAISAASFYKTHEHREMVTAEANALTGGDAARAPALMRRFGCTGCHTIPGILGADGLVGPPLTRMRARVYLAGRAPNGPDTMVQWLLDPHSIDERTAMPRTGLSEPQARDIAAYLYTLD